MAVTMAHGVSSMSFETTKKNIGREPRRLKTDTSSSKKNRNIKVFEN